MVVLSAGDGAGKLKPCRFNRRQAAAYKIGEIPAGAGLPAKAIYLTP